VDHVSNQRPRTGPATPFVDLMGTVVLQHKVRINSRWRHSGNLMAGSFLKALCHQATVHVACSKWLKDSSLWKPKKWNWDLRSCPVRPHSLTTVTPGDKQGWEKTSISSVIEIYVPENTFKTQNLHHGSKSSYFFGESLGFAVGAGPVFTLVFFTVLTKMGHRTRRSREQRAFILSGASSSKCKQLE